MAKKYNGYFETIYGTIGVIYNLYEETASGQSGWKDWVDWVKTEYFVDKQSRLMDERYGKKYYKKK